MSTPPGPSAFPANDIHAIGDRFVARCIERGMTLTDYFAGEAMKKLLGAVSYTSDKTWQENTASQAYEMAEAMLAERKRRYPSPRALFMGFGVGDRVEPVHKSPALPGDGECEVVEIPVGPPGDFMKDVLTLRDATGRVFKSRPPAWKLKPAALAPEAPLDSLGETWRDLKICWEAHGKPGNLAEWLSSVYLDATHPLNSEVTTLIERL